MTVSANEQRSPKKREFLSQPTGRYLLDDAGGKDDFMLRYKGIRQCYRILRWTVCGSYVNFGVFRLYGDQALEICLRTVYDLFVRFQSSTVLSYPKLRLAFFDLIDIFTSNLMAELAATMPVEVYRIVTQSLAEGIRSAGKR